MHALSWAQERSGNTEPRRGAKRRAGWLSRGLNVFPPADPGLGAAAIDALDAASVAEAADLQREALDAAQPALDATSALYFDVQMLGDVKGMVASLHEPELVRMTIRRYAEGLLESRVAHEGRRLLVLSQYDFDDIVEQDAAIAGLSEALIETNVSADGSRIRGRLGFALGSLLKHENRVDECAPPDPMTTASDETLGSLGSCPQKWCNFRAGAARSRRP